MRKSKSKILSGLYVIEFVGSNRFYIGSSINLNKRKDQHFRDLKFKRHANKYLQNVYNKYGADSFKFTILAIVDPDIRLIRKMEQNIIQSYIHDKDMINISTRTDITTREAMFTDTQIVQIFNLISSGKDYSFVAKKLKSNKSAISRVILRDSYRLVHIDESIEKKAYNAIKRNIPFSKEDIDFINNNYKKIGAKKCGLILGRSAKTVSEFARKSNIKHTKVWTKEEEQYILDNFGKLNLKDMSLIINRSIGSIDTKYRRLINA